MKQLDRLGQRLLGHFITTLVARHGYGKALESAIVWNVSYVSYQLQNMGKSLKHSEPLLPQVLK